MGLLNLYFEEEDRMKKLTLYFLTVVITLLVCSNMTFAFSYFQNPGFETGDLSFWDANGIVSVIKGDSYVSSPYEGTYMLLLSKPGDEGGGYLTDNYINQKIDAKDVDTISFWYNFFTADYDNDHPGFKVTINNNSVLFIDADNSSLIEVNDPIYNSGWLEFSYDVSSYSGELEVSIYAGNTVDNKLNSWVYLDAFSPNQPSTETNPVPLPATLTFLTHGLGLFFIIKWFIPSKI